MKNKPTGVLGSWTFLLLLKEEMLHGGKHKPVSTCLFDADIKFKILFFFFPKHDTAWWKTFEMFTSFPMNTYGSWDLQIIAFSVYLHFTQRPIFVRIVVAINGIINILN